MLVLSKWSTLYRKNQYGEVSFKHWKWASTLLFGHLHWEVEILLFVKPSESLHTQRFTELAVNKTCHFFPMYFQATAEKLCLKSPLKTS